MKNTSQINNKNYKGGNPVGAPLYPPTLISTEPYLSVDNFTKNNCLKLIENQKVGNASLLEKTTTTNCLRTLRIMNILTLTYTDYIKYLTIVKSYYENPLYFKTENGKRLFFNTQQPDTQIYTIQFIGTTFLNDNITTIINKDRLVSLLNHIQPHYYLYLIDSSTNIPPAVKQQIYNRMSELFVIKNLL